jgi:subtilase family protein/caspase domain-containing protein
MRRAFVIGSNGPPGPRRLKFAVDDAEKIKATLESRRCGFSVELPKLRKAWDLLACFSKVVSRCEAEDTFVFYFSGHGKIDQGDLFLLWNNTRLDDLFDTGLPMSIIREALKHCRAQNKLFILDCCHAGALVGKTGLKAAADPPKVSDVFEAPENHLALLASSRIEQTREFDFLQGSFLTYHVVDAISNALDQADKDRDGVLSIDDLAAWLRQKAEEHNSKHRSEKVPTPFLYGQRRGEFFLTLEEKPSQRWPSVCGIQQAHRRKVQGQNVPVFVLDTGCDAGHDEFKHALIDFRFIHQFEGLKDVYGCDVEGHGTMNCGVIAGRNIGIAPQIELRVASVLESETLQTSFLRITSAMEWMLDTLRKPEYLSKTAILFMPVGFRLDPKNGDRELFKRVKVWESLVKTLSQNNVLCIAPSGNHGPNTVLVPGAFQDVLSVGAVDAKLRLASFSSYGKSPYSKNTKPDVVGIGVDVNSSIPRSSTNRSLYDKYSGGSPAAAYVTGIAALYAARFGLRGNELKKRIIETAYALDEPKERVGAGLARFIFKPSKPSRKRTSQR